MTLLRIRSALAFTLAAMAAAACGGEELTLPESGESVQIQAVQGDEQVGRPGERLTDPLVVRLVDEEGRGIANRTLVWVVSPGGGSITPATGTTDAEGFATAEWTLGPAPGTHTVTAQVPGVGTATFTAVASSDGGGGGGGSGGSGSPDAVQSTITAEPAAIEAGTGAATITVTVRDEDGDPVSGALVELGATGGGVTLEQPVGPTGGDGRAVGTLRGSAPGDKVVSATVNGTLLVAQTAVVTVTAPPATLVDRLVYLVPPRDVEEGETFPVEVALVDADGGVVPLSGVFIYIGLFEEGKEAPNNKLLQGERFENTEDGVAKFEIKVTKKGRYILRALTDDLPELGPHGPEPYLYSEVFEVD